MNLKTLALATGFAAMYLAGSAQATVLSSYLTFDGPQHTLTPGGGDSGAPVNQGGGEDALIDDSLTAWVDQGTIGAFDDGDIFWGIVTISEALASGQPSVGVGASGQIAFVYSAIISGPGTTDGFGLVPITDTTSIYYLGNLLDPSVQQSIDGNTIAVGLSTTTSDANSTNDPLNQTTANILAGNFFTSANNWNWEMSMGIVASTDYFDFLGAPNAGLEAAIFTIQDQAFSANWLPVDVAGFNGDVTTGDFGFTGVVTAASDSQLANGWSFADDSRGLVNPVPEPATLGLLGLGLIGVSFSAARRRKVAA